MITETLEYNRKKFCRVSTSGADLTIAVFPYLPPASQVVYVKGLQGPEISVL